MSPVRRRRAAEHVYGMPGVSERRACRVLRQPPATLPHDWRVADDEAELAERIWRAGGFGCPAATRSGSVCGWPTGRACVFVRSIGTTYALTTFVYEWT